MRLVIVLLFLILGFGGLGGRLFYIQILQSERYNAYADEHHLSQTVLYPIRGTITDRHGRILAKSKKTKAIFVNPLLIADPDMTKDPEALVKHLVEILNMDAEQVCQRATATITDSDTGEQKFRREVLLARKPDEDQIKAVESLIQDRSFFLGARDAGKNGSDYTYKGVYFRDRVERVYPADTVLCHVLGFTQDEQTPGKTIIRDDMNPQRGLELTLDSYLRGREGWREGEVDKIRRIVISEKTREVPAVNGNNVILSIDLHIQLIVEKEIEAAAGELEFDTCSALVMDPATGEILAMAGYPNFNSNGFSEITDDALRNHAIETLYEPGSTMKAVTGSIALELGVLDMDTEFYCEKGAWRVPGHTLHDSHPYETLTFREVIEKSSNIGIAKVALLIGEERLHKYILAFGFNKPTGIGVKEEAAGFVWPLSKWSKLSIYEVPMGQEISVTSLQLATAFCAIANGGNLMKPILVKRIEDESGLPVQVQDPEIARRVLSEPTTRKMKTALAGVVSEDGTATKADIKGYTEAGKTGTAQKVVDGRYSNRIFDSTFVGFAPVNEPRVVILVSLNGTVKPHHYAGTVAAPIFSRIGEQVLKYLEVPKDAPEELRNVARN